MAQYKIAETTKCRVSRAESRIWRPLENSKLILEIKPSKLPANKNSKSNKDIAMGSVNPNRSCKNVSGVRTHQENYQPWSTAVNVNKRKASESSSDGRQSKKVNFNL